MHEIMPNEKTTENKPQQALSGYNNLNRVSVAPMLDGMHCD